jgi:RNA polymerase sigma-70 factor (ECF subfamily)
LLPQAVKGDRASLSQVLLLHYDGLRRHIARRISGDLERLVAADDILHQTMVRAAQGIGRYQPRHEGAFRGWLTKIADNLIKDAQRRKRRERRAAFPDGPGHAPVQNSSWAALVEKIAGDGSTPSVKTQRSDNARRLRVALAALPDDYRQVVERFYLQDQSLAEIADALGSTKGSVRAICYRARKRLRELMGRSSLYFSE